MSANNWTKCPKCEAKLSNKKAVTLDKARKCYGKVSAEEFESRMGLAKAFSGEALEDTLREDYELGIDGNTFSVSYRASCEECDFSFEFRESMDVSQKRPAT